MQQRRRQSEAIESARRVHDLAHDASRLLLGVGVHHRSDGREKRRPLVNHIRRRAVAAPAGHAHAGAERAAAAPRRRPCADDALVKEATPRLRDDLVGTVELFDTLLLSLELALVADGLLVSPCLLYTSDAADE